MKKDPTTLNGVHKLKADKDGIAHTITLQWYPGVGMFYAILDADPACQMSITEKGARKFLKDNELVEAL